MVLVVADVAHLRLCSGDLDLAPSHTHASARLVHLRARLSRTRQPAVERDRPFLPLGICANSPLAARESRDDHPDRARRALDLSAPARVPVQAIVRQQWSFSPHGSTSEVEDYQIDLDSLELEFKPDLA